MQTIVSNCDIPEISVVEANSSYLAFCSNNTKSACSSCFKLKKVPCEIVNCIYEKISELTGVQYTTNCVHPGLKKYVIELQTGIQLSNDLCPNDPNKIAAGICGCGVSDNDIDGDGTVDCNDACPNDPNKIVAGICGCGITDSDTDADGTVDCNDACPNDPNKIIVGVCGCGVVDSDLDGDGNIDCNDLCPNDVNKLSAGICGCGIADSDTDSDGTVDCNDACPNDPNKIVAGTCGCGVSDNDTDGDGTQDCNDECPNDPNKIAIGSCGCGIVENSTDSDNDGTLDCIDGCALDPNKIIPGICGCGVVENSTDSDNDGVADCVDSCTNNPCVGSAQCQDTGVDSYTCACDGLYSYDENSAEGCICPLWFISKNNECKECTGEGELACSSPRVCDTSQSPSQCVSCQDSLCLAKNPNKPVCGIGGECVECNTSQDCATYNTQGENYCDVITKTCVVCLSNNAGCSEPTPVCDYVAQRCVDCMDNNDCMAGTRNICDLDYNECIECKTNKDCTNENELCDYDPNLGQVQYDKCYFVGCSSGVNNENTNPDGTNVDCPSYAAFCDPLLTACVECFQDEHCDIVSGQYCSKNKCWDADAIFIGKQSMVNGGHYLQINESLTTDYGTRAIGCYDKNVDDNVICVKFNESDCWKKTFIKTVLK